MPLPRKFEVINFSPSWELLSDLLALEVLASAAIDDVTNVVDSVATGPVPRRATQPAG